MSESPIPRKAFEALLRPLLPKTWQLISTHETTDNLDTVIVKIKQVRIEPHPQAPELHLISFIVTPSVPGGYTRDAEDRLDREVNEVLHALDDLDSVWWSSAEKVDDTNRLAYDINASLASNPN